MLYLKCIALLEHLRKMLYAGQRKQVSVQSVPQIEQTIIGVQTMLKDENLPLIQANLNDIMGSLIHVKSIPNLQCLTENMKQSIVDSVDSMITDLCLTAFKYYSVNDFEPTEPTIKVMRKVVKVALEKGVA